MTSEINKMNLQLGIKNFLSCSENIFIKQHGENNLRKIKNYLFGYFIEDKNNLQTTKVCINHLMNNYNPMDLVMISVWTEPDIEYLMVKYYSGIIYTKRDVSNILQLIHHRHDADVGISWEVITCHIEMYFDEWIMHY